MIGNIIDHRKRPYRFLKINAVIEPTRHDNRVKNSDRAKANPKQDKAWIGYDEREHVSLADALQWAHNHKDTVTLYLWDADSGIYPVPAKEIRRALEARRKQRKTR